MPYKEDQPTFIGSLSIPIVTKVAKTRPFGGPYIRFYDLCTVSSYLYTSGAILGRARRNKLSILAKLFSIPGTEKENMAGLQEEATKRLTKFKNEVGNEPDTFNEFILFRELESATGLGMEDWFKAYAEGDTKIMKIADEKVPLEKAEPSIKWFGLEGIGFGSSFPELTEKIYRNSYENIDMDVWAKHKAHGLAIPEKPDIVTLKEQEKSILGIVAAYTSEYYPELLDPLDLRSYLDVGSDF
jgi:hypothetical protein